MNINLHNNIDLNHVRALEATISTLENELNDYKNLEAENAKSISFLSGLLEQSLAGIYVIDSTGCFSYVNQVFADIFFYASSEEIIGKFKVECLVAPESRELVRENIKKRASGEVNEMRYTFTGLRKDGSRNTVEVHGRSMTIGGKHFLIGLMIDMTDYQRMSELAFYDSLTNLPNRALVNDRLAQVTIQAKRSQKSFAILFIDLDGFKEVNDTYGHAAGDHVLKQSAQRMLSQFRTTDTVSRLGGDEFVVILTEVNDQQSVARAAAKLLKQLESPIDFQEHVISVSACIGISLYPQNGVEPIMLLNNADSAMYKAKEYGKHTYVFAE